MTETTQNTRPPFNAPRFRAMREEVTRLHAIIDSIASSSRSSQALNRWRNAEIAVAALLPSNMWGYSDRVRRMARLHLASTEAELEDCPCCGSTYPSRLMLDHDDGGDRYCMHCAACDDYYITDWIGRCYDRRSYDDDNDMDGSLMGAGASPIDSIGKSCLSEPGEVVTPKTRLFGCEIEFVARDDEGFHAIVGNHAKNDIGIYKADGSLPGYGAEFCTLPMTRKAVHRLKPILDRMVEKGARAWNRSSCGLHIHVTRDSASWLTWGKVARFFSSKDNQTFLDLIAGRETNSYCQRFGADPLLTPVKKGLNDFRSHAERYVALNFATHKPTVEFRLFRGNTSYGGVLRAIQFCDSIIEFARTQSNTAPMNHADYKVWLRGRAKSYPNVVKLVMGRDRSDTETTAA